MCIDELDEQGELVAKALLVGLAHESVFIFGHQGVEWLTVHREAYSLVSCNARQLPTLSDVWSGAVEPFERSYLFASPEGLLQYWLKP